MQPMAVKIAILLALVGYVLATGGADHQQTSSASAGTDSTATTQDSKSVEQAPTSTKGSYFGVDPNDKEAVKRVQAELGEEKFKQLFGDDVNLDDLKFHNDDGEEAKGHFSLKKGLEKLFEMLKKISNH
jgi:hypothetical protein